MASIAFDNNTIREIMTLIDEHKNGIQEGEYIKIKDLHEQSFQPIKQEYVPLQRTDSIPIDPNVYIHTHINHLYTRVGELTKLKQEFEENIELNIPMTTYKGRLTLKDKHNVLINLLDIDDEMKPQKKTVYLMQKHIIDHQLMTINDLKKLYTKEKNSRISNLRENAIRRIEDMQLRISRLNNQIESKTSMIEQLSSIIMN